MQKILLKWYCPYGRIDQYSTNHIPPQTVSLKLNLKINAGKFFPLHEAGRMLFPGICLLFSLMVNGQRGIDSVFNKWNRFSEKVGKTSQKIDEKLTQKTSRLLQQCEKQERKLYKKLLNTKDSVLARKKLSEIDKEYSSLKEGLNDTTSEITGTYIPSLDSLGIALQCKAGELNNKIALEKLNSLKQQFNQSEKIRKIIQERKQKLKDLCGNSLPAKYWKQFNKQVYYYNQQLVEYRQMLNDPDKLLKKVLAVLRETKLFQDLFRNNSQLAALFRMPNDPSQLQLQGLQSRVQIDQIIQQQFGGQAGLQQLKQNLTQAQAELNKLKDKVLKAGATGSGGELPEGFKPNNQKTKSFWNRIELGTNLQSEKAKGILHVRSDIGLSLGYKLNDKSVIGIGGSYKLGWGNGWQHLRLSSEGMSMRSFVDWKMKGHLYISGGYEMHYNSTNSSVPQFGNAWQQSGLIGLSRQLPIKTKFFSKTKLLLLWDFLSYQQLPRTQPIIFRIGYSFK